MNNIRVKVDSDGINLINYLVNHNIYYNDLYKENNYYFITISFDNYKTLRRRFECEVIRYYGKEFIINFLISNKYILISLVIGLLVLHLLCSTIFEININVDDESIKNIILESLKENGIDKYKRKKDFNELINIKEKILDRNKDTLEWIEINEKGCTYNIDVTPRIKEKELDLNEEASDIVARKDGKILYIVSESGTKLKDINDYVKKNDILISGNITKGDDVIYQVKSKGKVYAEVWYSVNITVPFNYTEYVNTGKIINHYYLDIFNYKFTLLGKYNSNNVIRNKSLLLNKPYLPFKLYKEEISVYEYKDFKISEQEAYEEAIKRSENKIKKSLSDDEYIISKKVLKKEVFSSKIKLEIFFKTYENIGMNLKIEKKEF